MPVSGPSLDTPALLSDLLAAGLAIRPDDVALEAAGERMTWSQLEAATSTFARQLLGLGVRPGDRVASLMPNRPALIVHYLACLKAGLVVTGRSAGWQPALAGA